MLERLLIAGSGGQGIILAGRLLASVAIRQCRFVTFFPAYGAEVRGGTSNCHVVMSSEEIADPLSEELDTMIIMNQAGIEKFIPLMTRKCLVLINSSMGKAPSHLPVIAVPATELANQLGSTRTANFIMLGAYVARKKLVPPEAIEGAIRDAFAGKDGGLIESNLTAFRTGLQSQS